MSTTLTASITRNSNGSLELTPVNSSSLSRLELGSEIEVTINTVRSAADIEKERGGKARVTASGTRGVRDQLEPVAEETEAKGRKK
ncbi:MAG TPA: hypothetical protein VNJ04_06955 [Gemmatimonadaceae bacterium]|nr:hypothetical protein [Gemmatimonadaceae bacterium]